MRIAPVNNQSQMMNNCVQPKFKSNPSLRFKAVKPLEERGKAVLQYIEQGCPKTKEGEKLFNEMFTPEIYDLYRMCVRVEDILAKCGDNLELITRTLGKYGLELYGNLPQGSTITNKKEGVCETGYWSKFDDLNTNFMSYLLFNPKGTLTQLEERFGNHSPLWLDRMATTGQISVDLCSYKVLNDLVDTSSVAVDAQCLRANAIKKYLDERK